MTENPSGTAGRPILGQIVSNDLTNVLIVVVRYFGGILLGTSGLLNAYKSAAADAILNADIVEKFVYALYRVSFDYQQMNPVMKIVKEYDLETNDQKFEMSCSLVIKVKLGLLDSVYSKFSVLEGVETNFLSNE
jgi:putative IMPACT (imprinted ancient) family translation regulator